MTLPELYGVYAGEKASKILIFMINNTEIESSRYIQQQWLIILQGMEVKYCLCMIGTAFSVCYTEYGDVYILERHKVLCTIQIQSGLQIFVHLNELSVVEMFVKRSLS